jgi:hypothetical protein
MRWLSARVACRASAAVAGRAGGSPSTNARKIEMASWWGVKRHAAPMPSMASSEKFALRSTCCSSSRRAFCSSFSSTGCGAKETATGCPCSRPLSAAPTALPSPSSTPPAPDPPSPSPTPPAPAPLAPAPPAPCSRIRPSSSIPCCCCCCCCFAVPTVAGEEEGEEKESGSLLPPRARASSWQGSPQTISEYFVCAAPDSTVAARAAATRLRPRVLSCLSRAEDGGWRETAPLCLYARATGAFRCVLFLSVRGGVS